jgi:hypothetical protein
MALIKKSTKMMLMLLTVAVLVGLSYVCIQKKKTVPKEKEEEKENLTTKSEDEKSKDYWKTNDGKYDSLDETLGDVKLSTKDKKKLGSECAGKNAAFVSSDLLPKKKNVFQEYSPDLKGMNLLSTNAMIGIDTVSNTLRNANYSIRSEPPNPKTDVSPWLNSTIDPDPYRKPMLM